MIRDWPSSGPDLTALIAENRPLGATVASWGAIALVLIAGGLGVVGPFRSWPPTVARLLAEGSYVLVPLLSAAGLGVYWWKNRFGTPTFVRLLNEERHKIVWLYVLKYGAGIPFVQVGLIDGSKESISPTNEDYSGQDLLATLIHLVPNATVGYTKSEDKRFQKNPASFARDYQARQRKNAAAKNNFLDDSLEQQISSVDLPSDEDNLLSRLAVPGGDRATNIAIIRKLAIDGTKRAARSLGKHQRRLDPVYHSTYASEIEHALQAISARHG